MNIEVIVIASSNELTSSDGPNIHRVMVMLASPEEIQTVCDEAQKTIDIAAGIACDNFPELKVTRHTCPMKPQSVDEIKEAVLSLVEEFYDVDRDEVLEAINQ